MDTQKIERAGEIGMVALFVFLFGSGLAWVGGIVYLVAKALL
jgi:hypothetical protein